MNIIILRSEQMCSVCNKQMHKGDHALRIYEDRGTWAQRVYFCGKCGAKKLSELALQLFNAKQKKGASQP